MSVDTSITYMSCEVICSHPLYIVGVFHLFSFTISEYGRSWMMHAKNGGDSYEKGRQVLTNKSWEEMKFTPYLPLLQSSFITSYFLCHFGLRSSFFDSRFTIIHGGKCDRKLIINMSQTGIDDAEMGLVDPLDSSAVWCCPYPRSGGVLGIASLSQFHSLPSPPKLIFWFQRLIPPSYQSLTTCLDLPFFRYKYTPV